MPTRRHTGCGGRRRASSASGYSGDKFSAAGLPLEGIGFIIAIDRVLDMMRTMTNVTGQMLGPVLVARETGLLDRAVYDTASSEVGLGPQDGSEEGLRP